VKRAHRAHRIIVAVIAASVVANLLLSGSILYSKVESGMNVSDTLNSRLPEMVNANAKVQPAAGAGATASVNGNDAVGQINITTGTKTTPGSLVHVTFVKPYATQPFVVVAPEDQPPPNGWYVTIDTEGFDIWVGDAPEANTNYPFAYFVVARPWLMYLNTSSVGQQD
jgi:hypothetical protein